MQCHRQYPGAAAELRALALALVVVVANLAACSCVDRVADEDVSPSPEVVVDMSAYGNVSCMRTSDLRAKCWGRGTWAQHGVQTTEAMGAYEPVADVPFLELGAGVEHISASYTSVCAILEGRRSFRCWGGTSLTGAWGYPFHGILGDDEPITDGQLIEVSAPLQAIDASARFYTCILFEDGSIKCFGVNGGGQLGYGHTETLGDDPDETVESLPTVDLGGPVAELALSDQGTSCARMVDGSVRCWGSNSSGLLGQLYPDLIGDDDVPSDYPPVELAGEPVVSLSAGPLSVCAVHADGALSCWGFVSPVLGYGLAAADAGLLIGDNETPASVGHVDVGAKVARVATGEYHTCVVLLDGGVKCWGNGTLVPLGYGTREIIGDDETPAVLEPLPLGGPAESVHVGEFHTCVVLLSGDVKCWGSPAAALGYGDARAPIGAYETLEDLPALDLW